AADHHLHVVATPAQHARDGGGSLQAVGLLEVEDAGVADGASYQGQSVIRRQLRGEPRAGYRATHVAVASRPAEIHQHEFDERDYKGDSADAEANLTRPGPQNACRVAHRHQLVERHGHDYSRVMCRYVDATSDGSRMSVIEYEPAGSHESPCLKG